MLAPVTVLLLGLSLPGTGPAVQAAAGPPGGFIEMTVAGVVPTQDGHTLVLVNAAEQVLLPVGIALPDAVAIHGRLEHLEMGRPMVHDVLEHIMKQLGGQIVRVQIDDLRDDVFVGTVFIRTPGSAGEVVAIDARPSDAVALAIGASAPIFVARPVVERAAIRAADLPDDEDEEAPPTKEAAPGKPLAGPGIMSL